VADVAPRHSPTQTTLRETLERSGPAYRGLKPQALIRALALKRPVVMVAYADWDPLSRKVRLEAAVVERKYRGYATFFFLDTDDESNASLLRWLDPGFLPEVAVLDMEGNIYQRFPGFVDSPSIEQGVLDVLP